MVKKCVWNLSDKQKEDTDNANFRNRINLKAANSNVTHGGVYYATVPVLKFRVTEEHAGRLKM